MRYRISFPAVQQVRVVGFIEAKSKEDALNKIMNDKEIELEDEEVTEEGLDGLADERLIEIEEA